MAKKIINLCNSHSQIRFCQISKFANNNLRVTDLYNLDKILLEKLDNEIIKKYPFVVKLNACNNSKITNVSHMKSLKKLNARGDCGIDDEGIANLDLVKFNARHNSKITNVSFMKSLKILDASSHCGINNEGIIGLNLVELYVCYNSKITNVSFMKSLQILDASETCGIDDEGITGLNLVQLFACNNSKITKMYPFIN